MPVQNPENRAGSLSVTPPQTPRVSIDGRRANAAEEEPEEGNVEGNGKTESRESYISRCKSRVQTISSQMTIPQFKLLLLAWAEFVLFPRNSPLWKEIKNNLKPGITVSLVSVPLSISLALAGGATPVAGVVTAFWGGIVAAFLGGSHYNIVGPTGALSGVLLSASTKYGDEILPALAIIGGILCLIVWILKLDKYVMFIPSSVVHGFTVGVAFIIGLNQLNSALGLPSELVGETSEHFYMNVYKSLSLIPHTNPAAIVWFAINLAALLLLLRKWPKIPWAIVIAGIGILAGWLTSEDYIPIDLPTLYDKYGNMNLQLIKIASFGTEIFNLDILTSAFAVAFIAILETLISARIADAITKTAHDQRREVFSIAFSNIICGSLGGIPATAALARTALNINSGATSRVAAVINSISVLIISVAVLRFFKYIPMSTFASLLVLVAIRMVAFHHLQHMFKYDKKMFIVAILSALACIFIDTMIGILIGAVISLLIFVDEMSRGHSEIQLNRGKKLISYINVKNFDSEVKKKKKARTQHHSSWSSLFRMLTQRKAKNSGDEKNKKPKYVFDDDDDDNAENNIEEGKKNRSKEFEQSISVPSDQNDEETAFSISVGDTVVYRITGQLTYINSIAHEERLKSLGNDSFVKTVILSLRYCWYIDLDGVDSLREMIQLLKHKGKVVLLAGVIQHNVEKSLSSHEFYQKKLQNGSVFPSYLDALATLPQHNKNNNDHHNNNNNSSIIDPNISKNNNNNNNNNMNSNIDNNQHSNSKVLIIDSSSNTSNSNSERYNSSDNNSDYHSNSSQSEEETEDDRELEMKEVGSAKPL